MLLRVENLKKYFQTPRGMLHAVDDVSFSIEKGKTLGVVGESGCGKSTLGRVILHLLDSSGGKIFFEDEDITNVKKKHLKELQRSMQIIFQDPFSSLNPRMTVSELIREPLLITKTVPKDQIDRRVKEIMDTVGLAERLVNSYPHELDGGRRQRIGVARALVLNPKFIVCDEPVSALDVSIQAQILNLLMDMQRDKGLTYMFITHNLSVVKHISDSIMVMYLGQCVEIASSDELFANPLHPYTRALLDAIPRPTLEGNRNRKLLRGEVFSPIDPAPGCRFAGRCEFCRPECQGQNIELVDMGDGHKVACTLCYK